MPCYEYQCKSCNKILQKWMSMKDMQKSVKCDCGKTAKKIISRSSFKINGFNEGNGYSNSATQ